MKDVKISEEKEKNNNDMINLLNSSINNLSIISTKVRDTKVNFEDNIYNSSILVYSKLV